MRWSQKQDSGEDTRYRISRFRDIYKGTAVGTFLFIIIDRPPAEGDHRRTPISGSNPRTLINIYIDEGKVIHVNSHPFNLSHRLIK